MDRDSIKNSLQDLWSDGTKGEDENGNPYNVDEDEAKAYVELLKMQARPQTYQASVKRSGRRSY
jgi:hypothetical protein